MSEPLKIRVDEERQALALADELTGIDGLEVGPEDSGWQVSVPNAAAGRLVPVVLDAVRRTLAGQPEACALVTLDGREYHLEGE